jgi:hypothetical protein
MRRTALLTSFDLPRTTAQGICDLESTTGITRVLRTLVGTYYATYGLKDGIDSNLD